MLGDTDVQELSISALFEVHSNDFKMKLALSDFTS